MTETNLKKLVKEDPDTVITNDFVLSFKDSDARAFGYYDNKMYVAFNNNTFHGNIIGKMTNSEDRGLYNLKRNSLKYPGRLWKRKKLLTFWTYPTPNEFKKVIKDINDNNYENIKIDNDWNVEIAISSNNNQLNKFAKELSDVLDDKLSIKEIVEILKNSQYIGYDFIIPVGTYNGSAKRASKKINKAHVLSPLLKEPQKVWTHPLFKNLKNISKAEYDSLKTKYKYTESIMESPDQISLDNVKAIYSNTDARAFGWWEGKLYVASNEMYYHGDLVSGKDVYVSRSELDFPGRIWLKKHLISFWKYPDKNTFIKLMKKLGKHKNINSDLLKDPWRVEISKDGSYIPNKYKQVVDSVGEILIPTKEYAGSNQRSEDELKQLHVLSPLLKKQRKVPQNKIKLPKGISQAEYKYLMTKYKFNEDVIREYKIRKLIREIILKEKKKNFFLNNF